jgi:hypothetical protein
MLDGFEGMEMKGACRSNHMIRAAVHKEPFNE